MKFLLALLFTFNCYAQVVSQGIPTGAVMKFDLTSCPTGWLPRDGSCVSQTTYAKLFQSIGSRYVSTFGACSTGYFRLADVRGLFDRAAGTNGTLAMANAAKYTAGSVGVYGLDVSQGHFHRMKWDGSAGGFISSNTVVGGNYSNVAVGAANAGYSLQAQDMLSDDINGTPRTGSETSPAYIATLDCIKY